MNRGSSLIDRPPRQQSTVCVEDAQRVELREWRGSARPTFGVVRQNASCVDGVARCKDLAEPENRDSPLADSVLAASRRSVDGLDVVDEERIVGVGFDLVGELRIEVRGEGGDGLGILDDGRGLQIRGEQVEGEDAGNDDDERNQQLQEGGKDDAPLTLGERLRAQGPLGDVLVEAPVEEVGDPQADDQRGPGDLGVVDGRTMCSLPACQSPALSSCKRSIAPASASWRRVDGSRSRWRPARSDRHGRGASSRGRR